MKTEIKRLINDNAVFFNNVIALLREGYQDQASKYFIYHDENYPNYLRKALSDKQNFWIYYLIDSSNNEFIGFAMFRVNQENVFLNQVIIKEGYRKHGLGRYLIFESLKQISKQKGQYHFKKFQLDAFHSNKLVSNFYKSMGMIPQHGLHWYNLKFNLIDGSLNEKLQEHFEIRTDENGFTHLYTGENNIGTIIKNDRAKINGNKTINLNQVANFLKKHSNISNVCVVSDKKIDLPLLDTTYLYTIDFSDTLKWQS